MKIRFHEKLYREGISDRRLSSIRRRVKLHSPKLRLYFVTLPLGNQGILEVYWYPELLQGIYKKLDEELTVVGIAYDREEAFWLVEKIIADIGLQGDGIPVKEFFEEHT
jgi:hypothetical protein